MKPVRILIVDDHYIVVEGIRSLLQRVSAVEILGSASDAESCMRFLDRRIPDLILLDISLPHTSGIDLCKAIHEKYPRIRILGLSTFKEQSFVRNMLDNGASGYVLKNAGIDELMIAIQTAMKGGKYLSDEVAAAIALLPPDIDSLIIDLRDNSGGLLESAVELCDQFLDEGEIVRIKRRDGELDRAPYVATPGTIIPSSIRMVVLFQ